MEKKYSLILLTFFCTLYFGFGQSDVIISQYIETDSGDTPKGIEIFNISGSDIDFSISSLEVYQGTNGGPCNLLLSINSGILALDEVWVIGTIDLTSFANTNGNNLSGITTYDFEFNGNDALQIYLAGNLQDVFGLCGSDPGNSWTGGGVSTQNNNLQINDAICDGSLTGFTDPSSRFNLQANGSNMIGFGNAPPSCSVPAPEIQIIDDTFNDQNCGYTIDYGAVATDGSFLDLTFHIENIGTADLNVSSLIVTGDYNVVGPTTPFAVPAGNLEVVTLRFQPSSNGIQTGQLTINNDDSNEGSCTVNLTGTGFTPGSNINVRGVIGSNPTIPNGSTTPIGFNNTLFAQQTIGFSSQSKSFRIGNEGGALDLNVFGITLTGDTSDFFITSSLSNPFAPDTFQDFTITFQPTTESGIRTATVSIANSDADKNPYTFLIQGRANCATVSGSIFPDSGPAGTTVIVNSVGNDLVGATAELNGVALDIVSDATNELVVRLPNIMDVGGSLSVELATGCVFSNPFTLIDDTISGCDTSSSNTVDNLFISQITDSPTGNLTYIEIYNATGTDIDFSINNYAVEIFFNGSSTSNSGNVAILNSGIIPDGGVYVISAGESQFQCAVPGGDGSLGNNDNDDLPNGINFGSSTTDFIRLTSIGAINTNNLDGIVDVWGVSGDTTWAEELGLGSSGANFERNTSATVPNTVYNNADWLITNLDNCSDVDYSTIGNFDFSTGAPPSISSQSDDPDFNCRLTETLSVEAIEGFDEAGDTKNLDFRWFVNAPSSNTWDEILMVNTNYSGQQTAVLEVLDTNLLNNYQYYCQVRENDDSCFKASNAIKLSVLRSLWDGANWTELPDSNRVVILNGDYDTSLGGIDLASQLSFEACKLIINSGAELIIGNGDFVEVENDLIVDGSIIVRPTGSIVQINNSAVVNGNVTLPGNRNKIAVEKLTATMASHEEWTYWSSPVSGEAIEDGLNESNPSRRYYFDAQNYLDETAETNNNGATDPGQDDVDDNGDDWQQITLGSTVMEPGVGYASTHNSANFINPGQYLYTFNGPFNNGIITVPIYRNDAEIADNNWNLIGNPYPSAINVDDFLSLNAGINPSVPGSPITGAIYLWSHNTPASEDANGNEAFNYSSSDYAIINGVAEVAGGDGVVPDRIIPSGQGFFVAMDDSAISLSAGGDLRTTDVTFANEMRRRGPGDNDQFFRTDNNYNKIRLNLTSNNNIFSQIVIAYVDGATSNFDGMFYDAPRNQSTNTSSLLYSIIDNSNSRFAIQGKAIEDLSNDEIIPLGFSTSIEQAVTYKISIVGLEGDFMVSNPVYVWDNFLNLSHDLTQSDYMFTSEVGTYNGRFEIRFNESLLTSDTTKTLQEILTVIELDDGSLKLSVSKFMKMNRIEIIDLSGRILYDIKLNNSSVILRMDNLSQTTYFAKVLLSNGSSLIKKAIKLK